MMTFTGTKKIKPFLLIIFVCVALIAILYLIALATTHYQVNSGATVAVNEWSVCKNVTNNNAKALFVPTNTSAEWSAFITNKPADVTLADCAPVNIKKIFVTSTNYTDANLGGLSGADTKCATHASNAGLSGTWKAWLSDGTTSAASRLSHSSNPYYNMNNQKVANNWSGLINGTLQAAINYNESGVQITGSWKWVWTGTNTDGTINSASRTCVNWTSSNWLDGDAMAGWADSTDYHWTQDGSENCNVTGHLYCVEQ